MQGDMLRYYSRNQIFLSQMGIWPYQSMVIKILLPSFLVATEVSTFITQVYINIFIVMFMTIPLMPKILDIIIPLNESRPVIYVIEGDWKVDKEKYYYPILLHCYLTVVVTIRIMVHVDTMYMVCVLHGCSLFNAIGIRLENIFDKTKFMKGETVMNKEFLLREEHEDYCEMIACLKKHQLAIKYTRILDSTFRSATFLILFLNVLILSLIGLQLINKLGQTQEVIRFGCIAVGSITHLLSICFPGQLLLDRSIDVFNKAQVMQTAMSYFTTFLSVN
ncbi:uncharacterized protein LOC112637313 [Camponotus floridanus]|uniref:uncharacterized protein LOC112637313 n=1 Tax=Camponotus floridanus TaxID=104421 RepID=UPI000DC6BF25|nr:uncharacterized protein LOC112637313 [Camponotus floridanus]